MKPLWKRVVTLKTKSRTTMLLLFIYLVMSNSLDTLDYIALEFLVLHYLLEFAQTHVHWVDDAIKPSHPLLSPSPPAFNLCQHQGLSKWVSSLNQVAKLLKLQLQPSVLPMNIQSGLTGLIFELFKGLSRVFSNTTVQKHQLFGVQPSLQLNSHIHTWLLENHSLHYTELGW